MSLRHGETQAQSVKQGSKIQKQTINQMSQGAAPFYWIVVLACLFSGQQLAAQSYTISGKVLDLNTQEPIPFANVFIPSTTTGTSSDIDGNYSLSTTTFGDSITASSVGYGSLTKPLKNWEEQKVNFYLDRSSVALREVVVSSEEQDNPAHVLLRKVIKQKPNNDNRKSLDSYAYEAHNKIEIDAYDWSESFLDRKIFRPFKFVFDNIDSSSLEEPFLPIFLSETMSNFYSSKSPNQEREIIKASKISGFENKSITQMMGTKFQEINVYDNWPEVLVKPFVSPVANSALTYYDFFLADSAFIDDLWCYKLNFYPKGKGTNTFVGEIWIADETYAVKKVSMESAGHVDINFVQRISFHQEFDLVGDSIWMLSKDKISIKFKAQKNQMGLIGKKSTTYREFIINDDGILEVFTDKADIEVAKDAYEKSDSFWVASRHEKLTGGESGIYDMIDSVSNTKAFRNWKAIFKTIAAGHVKAKYVEFGSVWNIYSGNQVERDRVQLGMRTTSKLSDKFRLGGYAAYGFGDSRWKYGAEALVFVKKDPVWWWFKGSYKDDLDLTAEEDGDISQGSFLAGFIRRNGVPQKFLHLHQFKADYHHEWLVGMSAEVGVRYREVSPYFPFYYIQRSDEVNGGSISRMDTIRNFRTAEVTGRVRFAYKEQFITGAFNRTSLGTKDDEPVISLAYTIGISGILGSQFKYHKLKFHIQQEVEIDPIGEMIYDVYAGKVFGRIPGLLGFIPQGNESWFFTNSAFNLMNEYEFITDQYVSAIVHHHFGGFFFQKIPGIRKLKLRSLIFGKVLWGNMSKRNREANSLNRFIIPNRKPYVEAGVGIENILRFFRVDVIWRLTYRDEPLTSNFGVRFGAQITF